MQVCKKLISRFLSMEHFNFPSIFAMDRGCVYHVNFCKHILDFLGLLSTTGIKVMLQIMLQKSPLQACAVSHRSTIFFQFVYRYGFQTCLLWYIKILKCIVIVIFKHFFIPLTDYFECSFIFN